MYKTYLHTIIKEKDKKKFDSLCEKKNLSKRGLFTEALNYFKLLVSKNKNYQFTYQEVDKITDANYTISVFDNTYSEIKNLSKQFNISTNRLVREIVCVYNGNNHL